MDGALERGSMRIVQVCFEDSAASAYCLAHALNKFTKHQAISIRCTSNYLRYPTMIDASQYSKEAIKNIIEKADVVHFHEQVKPFFDAFDLNKKRLEKAKKLVYF